MKVRVYKGNKNANADWKNTGSNPERDSRDEVFKTVNQREVKIKGENGQLHKTRNGKPRPLGGR